MQKKNTMLHGIMSKILFGMILIAIWQLIYFLGVDCFGLWKAYAFPSPKGVLEALISLSTKGSIGIAIAKSMQRVITGYLLSLVLGIIIGLFITKFHYLNAHLKPFILGIQTLPSICWVPFAILWFGLNDGATLFVIVIGSAFSMSISVEQAIHHINPLYINAAKTMGARGMQLYTKVILPASIPSLISGCKQGWSFAWRALMSGEVMFASKGLGQVLTLGRDLADINQVMAVIIIIILLGVVIDYLIFKKIELRVKKQWGLL